MAKQINIYQCFAAFWKDGLFSVCAICSLLTPNTLCFWLKASLFWGLGPPPHGLPSPRPQNNLPQFHSSSPKSCKERVQTGQPGSALTYHCSRPSFPTASPPSLFCLGFIKTQKRDFVCPQNNTSGEGEGGNGAWKIECSRGTELILPDYTW